MAKKQVKNNTKSVNSPKRLILEAIRTALKLKKKQMAELMGISDRAYDGYLYNGKTPKDPVICKLIAAGACPTFYHTGQGAPLSEGFSDTTPEGRECSNSPHSDAPGASSSTQIGVDEGKDRESGSARRTLPMRSNPEIEAAEFRGEARAWKQAHDQLAGRVEAVLRKCEKKSKKRMQGRRPDRVPAPGTGDPKGPTTGALEKK